MNNYIKYTPQNMNIRHYAISKLLVVLVLNDYRLFFVLSNETTTKNTITEIFMRICGILYSQRGGNEAFDV